MGYAFGVRDCHCSGNHGSDLIVRWDPNRLEQVLLNVVKNSIEAMENGGELKVGISSDDDGRQFSITVSDTGCGISPENFSQIFDPYFTTKSSGTGLGLAIVHNIIEAMGGRIKVKSDPGKGTAFNVTIPFSERVNSDR